MNSTIKAIIFDMDGVLIDSEPIHAVVVERIFEAYGIEISREEHQAFIGGTSRAMWAALKQQFNLSVSIDELLREDQDRYMKKLRSTQNLQPIDGAEQIIRYAKNHGLPLGLASSSTRENIDLVLSKLGYTEYFETTLSGEEVRQSKPSPEIFLKVAKSLNRNPENVLVIEDSENGTIGAKKAGMMCIGHRNASSGKQNLSGADWVVDNLEMALSIIKKWSA